MIEFITRSCKAESRYEVIIKTDSEEHYKATEDFARRLIDHAKPKTNADLIRSMDDETLASQLLQVAKEVIEILTKEEIPADLENKMWASILEKLQQPAEEV